MHPRTVAIIVAGILGLAFGLRWLVFQTGFLPVNDEVVLKTAVALRVTFLVRGNPKSVLIDEREDVQALLTELRVRREGDDYRRWGGPGPGSNGTTSVDFIFANGMQRNMPMTYSTQLGHHEIDSRFYAKLCEHLSSREGRRIDILSDNP